MTFFVCFLFLWLRDLILFLAEVCSQHGPEQMKTSEHNNNNKKKRQRKKNVQKYHIMLLNVIMYIYMIRQVCQLHLLEPSFIDYH